MESEQPVFELETFTRAITTKPLPLVIGGQAVNIWACYFASTNEKLQRMQPFTSKDCDLFGNAETLQHVASVTGWGVSCSPKGKASPVVGFVSGTDSKGAKLTIEVLYSVRGLNSDDLKQGVLVQLDHREYKTLSPIALLKAKVANLCELPQKQSGGHRDDLRHVEILVPCIAGYIAEAYKRLEEGQISERGLVNMLEATRRVLTAENANKVRDQYQVDFSGCFPQSIRNSSVARIKNFCDHRMPSLGIY